MNYREIILDGYFNNADFLPSYFYRTGKEYEASGIDYTEFYERSARALKELEDFRDKQFYSLQAKTITGTPIKEKFSVPLYGITKRGEHIGYSITEYMVTVTKKGLVAAYEKRGAEEKPEKSGGLTHREFCLINYYKNKAGLEPRLTRATLLKDYPKGNMIQAFYATIKGGGTPKELKKIIDYLTDFPEAQKAAINALAQLQ